LQTSRYSIEKDASVESRALSPETSEWLFAKGFWRDVNWKLGTLFDQFEEEWIAGEKLTALIEALEIELHALSEGYEWEGDKFIEFVYRWDASHREIRCKLRASVAIDDLKELISTLKVAQQQQATVLFEL
jgi:hypothetical protein